MSGSTQGGGRRWGGATAAPVPSPARIFDAADHVLWVEFDSVTTHTDVLGRVLISAASNKFAGVGGALSESDPLIQMQVNADALNGRPIAAGSASDRIGNTSATWIAANTSWRAYAVLRAETWLSLATSLVLYPMSLRARTGPNRWGWRHLGTGEEAFSTIGGALSAGLWSAVRLQYVDDTQIGIGVDNETVVTASIASSAAAMDKVSLSAREDGSNPAVDSHAMLVVVRGVPSDDDDKAMAEYINHRFGATGLSALTWGGAVYVAPDVLPQTGTQGAHIKRWAGAGRVPNNQRWAIPFPADGLPPLGIVDDGTGELIVDDTDADFIVEGLNA